MFEFVPDEGYVLNFIFVFSFRFKLTLPYKIVLIVYKDKMQWNIHVLGVNYKSLLNISIYGSKWFLDKILLPQSDFKN